MTMLEFRLGWQPVIVVDPHMMVSAPQDIERTLGSIAGEGVIIKVIGGFQGTEDDLH